MMPIEPDHYGILELAPGSPMEEVKAQYRRLAKRYHPDLHGNDAPSQEKFRRINAAYTFLSDIPRKAAYDDILKAARRMGAPPLKAAPPQPKAPSPTATGYHAPPPRATVYRDPTTGTGYHPSPPDSVRMTRSAWLGATAGAIVVLLVIGVSLNSPGPARPTGLTSPAPAAGASESPLGGGDMPDAGADPPPADPPFKPAPLSGPSVPLRVPTNAPRPRADPAQRMPSAQGRRLMMQPSAALPPADRVLRGRLAADLKKLSAARARVQPAPRLTAHETPAEQHRGAGPVRKDQRRAEDARVSVRADLRALSAEAPTIKAPPPIVVRAVPAPAPFISVPVSPPPAPPEKPEAKSEAKQAAKVKAPAPAGQEFIMWGK